MGKTLTGFLLLFLRPVKMSICQSIVLARSSLIMFSRPWSLCSSYFLWKQLRNQVSFKLNLCTLCKLELISRKLDFKTNASLVPLFSRLFSVYFPVCSSASPVSYPLELWTRSPPYHHLFWQPSSGKINHFVVKIDYKITHPPWQAVYVFCPRKKKKLYLVCNSRWKIPKKWHWRYTKTVLTSSFSQTSNNLCNTWASVNLEYLKTAHLDWIASD